MYGMYSNVMFPSVMFSLFDNEALTSFIGNYISCKTSICTLFEECGGPYMLRSTLAVFLVIHFVHDEISVTWMLHTEFSALFTNRLDVNIHL